MKNSSNCGPSGKCACYMGLVAAAIVFFMFQFADLKALQELHAVAQTAVFVGLTLLLWKVFVGLSAAFGWCKVEPVSAES